MMAAISAAEQGASVILLEKNEKAGKKLYITGKGRCNFTNDCLPAEFLENVVNGKKFLSGAIFRFPPEKTKEFFTSHGLKIKTERGNRVFPASDKASDVTKTLERALHSLGVTVKFQSEVKSIRALREKFEVSTQEERFTADAVIIATGGVSYPSTGSTGDGYRFAKEFSHEVIPAVPSLVGLNCKGDFKSLQGLSLKNVSLVCRAGSKKIYDGFGEMLFTHYGVSGPLVLSLSALINRMELSTLSLAIDLKPALTEEQLDKRLLRDFEQYKNKKMSNALVDLLPSSLISAVLKQSGVSGEKAVNSLSKEERGRILSVLKGFSLSPLSLRGFDEAIVTSGGVSLKEINPKTMESKQKNGLFFCGEVLDLDAFTGGFNLQIAFATGYLAGFNAAKEGTAQE